MEHDEDRPPITDGFDDPYTEDMIDPTLTAFWTANMWVDRWPDAAEDQRPEAEHADRPTSSTEGPAMAALSLVLRVLVMLYLFLRTIITLR